MLSQAVMLSQNSNAFADENIYACENNTKPAGRKQDVFQQVLAIAVCMKYIALQLKAM
jgi:hypothetical protein